MTNRLALLALAATLSVPLPAAAVTGWATVPDGDVLQIGGQLYRLYGIDAVETHQMCYAEGKPWSCGPSAIRTLEILVGPEPVVCTETGESAGGLGLWANCTVGGKDISDELVRKGVAVAFRPQSDRYVAAEDAARAGRAGIWRGSFVEPWVFREEMQAIGGAVAGRLRADAPAALEQALTEGAGGLDFLKGFQVVRSADGTVPREAVVTDIGDNFILAAVTADVFNWGEPAQAMNVWRAAVAEKALRDVAGIVEAEFLALPRRDQNVADQAEYFRALTDLAAPLIAAGRQPALLVGGRQDPPWLSAWFVGGELPAGAVITRKDGESERYVGTIDGIDVFTGGAADEGTSLLFARDILAEIRYAPDAAGNVVTAVAVPGVAGAENAVAFRFGQGLIWRAEPIDAIHYPFVPMGDVYGDGSRG